MSQPNRLASFVLVASLALAGCSSTRTVERWKAPGLTPADLSFEHVVAIAAVPEESRQRLAEDALVRTAEATKVTAAYTLVSQQDRASADRMRAALTAAGVDGAVTVRLIGVEDREYVVPGRTRVIPGGYDGYYGGVSTVIVQEPPETRIATYLVVETSLHDVTQGELLWSTVSETRDPSRVEDLIEEVVEVAGRQLAKDGLLP